MKMKRGSPLGSPLHISLGLVLDERGNFGVLGKDGAAVEGGQFDDEVDVDLLGVELGHELVGGGHGATGGEHVVVEHDDVVLGNSVAVDLDNVLTILFVIGGRDGVGREFARLTAGHESGSQFKGQNGTADEAAALDAHYLGYAFVAIKLGEVPADNVEGAGILERRGEVLEDDSLLGKSRTSRILDLMYSIILVLKFLVSGF